MGGDIRQGTDAAEQLFRLGHRDEGEVSVVSAAGELDMLGTPRFRQVLQAQLGRQLRLLVIDLDDLTFMGSSGLAVLVEAHEWAKSSGITLRVVASTPAVRRPLSVTALDRIIPVFPSLAEAMAPVDVATPALETEPS
jgi:anti-sigma B factor antagonist